MDQASPNIRPPEQGQARGHVRDADHVTISRICVYGKDRGDGKRCGLTSTHTADHVGGYTGLCPKHAAAWNWFMRGHSDARCETIKP